MLFVKFPEDGALVRLDIVVGDPESGDASPKASRELGEGMKEAVAEDLRDEAEDDISKT